MITWTLNLTDEENNELLYLQHLLINVLGSYPIWFEHPLSDTVLIVYDKHGLQEMGWIMSRVIDLIKKEYPHARSFFRV